MSTNQDTPYSPSILAPDHTKNFSYADVHGTWEDRKVSLMGPLKSLLSQLRVGQDMTKVSLPSVLLRPYSMIEEFGSRTLGHIPILYKSTTQTDALERMITVVSWVLSTTRDENFNHKPFNSILGETHVARLTTDDTYTYFFGEQISHHPPVTAFVVKNDEHQITITGTYTFSIKFAPNSIHVTTNGKCEIRLGEDVYIMEKSLPDMIIKNSLFGKKAVAWVGKMTVSCPKTGWHAELEYHLSKDLVKYVQGSILCLERTGNLDTPCLYFGGKCGGMIYKSLTEITNADKLQEELENNDANGGYFGFFATKKAPKKVKEAKNIEEVVNVMVDFTGKKELTPSYPPLENLPANSSRVVWKEAALHIVSNQMDKADEAKFLVEEGQRERSRELEEANETYEPCHFFLDGNLWRPNDDSLRELSSLF
eukprot:TRINITY_DN17335_c0_g1_i1.p1 TRINITY_DN17335_c0_g1~~TRINITY_DN17335_c0_g1_i1.p1  ORF type:complete len:424 (+),score=76.37 TRINITY_DN17335_c0_g1_i1:89-1360(+)